MRYIDLETAGILQIAYTGTPLDLYSHGVLSLTLHDVVERTAITLIERERLFLSSEILLHAKTFFACN